MKNIGALLIFVLLGSAAGTAVAVDEALPPTEALPGVEQLFQSDQPFDSSVIVDPEGFGGQYVEPIAEGDLDGALQPYCMEPEHAYFGNYPALMESTGTWLRRGFWFAEVDALILNRRFARDRTLLIYEGGNASPSFTFPELHSNELIIYPGDPGAEGLPRLKLGRFWFRDAANRDHTTELVWYGGGEWTQQNRLQSTFGFGLRVPTDIDRGARFSASGIPINDGNISFDGAQSSLYQYSAYLDSVEFNYQVKQRMKRDRMELQPDGEWVRKASLSRTFSFLAGVRYINLRDNLVWTANGIPGANDDLVNRISGQYYVSTDNDLIGTQIGGSMAVESDRWSVTASAKTGGYYNAIDMNSNFAVGTLNSGASNADTDNLSWVAECQLLGKWHFRPNMSIRASVELLVVESIAVAPHQFNFISGSFNQIAQGADNAFLGTGIGFESYW